MRKGIVVTAALVSIGLYFTLEGKSGSANASSRGATQPSKAQEQAQAKKTADRLNQTIKSADQARIHSRITALILNPQAPIEERLKAWEDLDARLPASAQDMYKIVLSTNPYETAKQSEKHEDPDHEAHSYDDYLYRQEESLRIMALQTLERAVLSQQVSPELLSEAASSAASPMIREIAAKIYEFARNGHSYSDMANQAIDQQPIPR